MPKTYFPRVQEARDSLREKAVELADLYDKAIRSALEHGQYEAAIKAIQWGLEHMPKSDDGQTVIDPSVDKVKTEKGPTGPTINIGLALNPAISHPALPPAIEAETVDDGTPGTPNR